MRFHLYDRTTRTEYCYATMREADEHANRLENCSWGRKPCEVFGCDTRPLMPAGRVLPEVSVPTNA